MCCTDCGLLCNACISYRSAEGQDCNEEQIIRGEEQLMVDLIDTIVYAGRLKDKSALMSSSSGGAFTALSDFFLKNDNAVVAAIYNY